MSHFLWKLQIWKISYVKEVPLHAPITWNTFQFKEKKMTNVGCFQGQHFSCLESIENTTRSACLCNYFERSKYPKRVIKGQKKINIWSYESRGKSCPEIKLIYNMLIDSLWSIIGINNHWKGVILSSKTFLDSWQKRATKSLQRRTLMGNDSRIAETVVYFTHIQ